MTYLALLRGINVGGHNKVPMVQLQATFEALGYTNVITYINSGNVLFSDARNIPELQPAIENALLETFGFTVKALVISKQNLNTIAAALPIAWHNDATMKCDIMFLWAEKNTPSVVNELSAQPGIDSIIYVDGALIWSVPRDQLTKSGLTKLVGTKLYKKMTIRNCNTVRTLAELRA